MAEERLTLPDEPAFTLQDVTAETSALGGTIPEQEKVPLYTAEDIPFSAQDALELGATAGQPSGLDYLMSGLTGTARGGTEGAILYGTTRAGYELGLRGQQALASTGIPQLQAVGRPLPFLGGAAGFVYSLFEQPCDKELDLVLGPPEREELRPTYEGSRTFGAGVTSAPLGGMFRLTPKELTNPTRLQSIQQNAANAINNIGEFARTNKTSFMARESAASLFAGMGGGTAVGLDPDSPGLRMGLELTAGALAPQKYVVDLVEGFRAGKTQLVQPGTSTSVNNYVANVLTDIVDRAGEDPKVLAQRLRENLRTMPVGPDGKTIAVTPAQMLDSPVLTSLERSLAMGDSKFGITTQKQAEQALETYNRLTTELLNTNDPSVLKSVANNLYATQSAQLDKALKQAYARTAETAATKLGPSATRQEIGDLLKTELLGVIEKARNVERQRWDEALSSAYALNAAGEVVPLQSKATNLATAYLDLVAGPGKIPAEDLAQYGKVNSAINRLVMKNKDLKEAKNLWSRSIDPTTLAEGKVAVREGLINSVPLKEAPVTELVALRSSLLADARSAMAGANPDKNKARVLSKLADAVLEDLSALDSRAYTRAREYSRAFNDVVSRTFVGKADDVTATGAPALPAETLVRSLVSGGSDPTYMRMRQISEAAKFAGLPGVNEPGRVRDTMRNVMMSALDENRGIMRRVTIDGVEQRIVDPAKLNDFRTRNAQVIKLLGMDSDFASVEAANRSLLDVVDQQSAFNKQWQSNRVLQDIIGDDDVATAISTALNSKKPVSSIENLVKVAKTRGEQGLAAVKDSLYQYAIQESMDSNGLLSFDRFNDVLFGRLSKNNPSLMQIMRDQNLITGAEFQTMRRMLQRPVRIERAIEARGGAINPEEFTRPDEFVSALDKLVLAQLSARFAGRVSPGGPGSLSFASRTIATVENLFRGLPARKRSDLILEAAKDPKLMAQLLEQGKTAAEQRALDLGILRRLYSPGVFPTAVERYIGDREYKDDRATDVPVLPAPSQSSMMLQKLNPVPTRGVAMGTPGQAPAAPTQTAAAAPQGPMPTGQPSSRDMLQKLFPMDTTLALG